MGWRIRELLPIIQRGAIFVMQFQLHRRKEVKFHDNINCCANAHCSNIEVNSLLKSSPGINSVQLLGWVGTEVEQNGTAKNPVIMFSMATYESYK